MVAGRRGWSSFLSREASPVARSGLFFRQGESNTWRFVLNRQQTEEVLANHSKMMQALGYIPPNLDDVYGAPHTNQARPPSHVV